MYFMRYPGGKSKALTLSYDDGVEQDIHLLDLMEKYGIKGTFNLNSGLFAEEGTVFPKGRVHRRLTLLRAKELYNSEMCEVAGHAFTHPFLEKMNVDSALWEVAHDRYSLEQIFERRVQGFAYPFGTYNDDVVNALKTSGYKYARTTISSHNFNVPTDWLRLAATCHHNDEMLPELAEKFINTTPNDAPYFFYVWGHSYEFEANDNWSVIEDFFAAVGGKDDVWYATNVELYDYITAFDRLEFSCDCKRVFNPSAVDVYIGRGNRIVCVPAGQEVSDL